MGGKAQVTDTSGFLLLQKILDAAAVQIGLAVVVEDGVEQIEVDVVGLEPLKLLLKDRFVIRVGKQQEFSRQIEAVPGVLFQRLSEKFFRFTVVIDVGTVVVVDTVGHGVVDDLLRPRPVNGRTILAALHRQAHIAHAQPGEGNILKGFCNHSFSPILISF